MWLRMIIAAVPLIPLVGKLLPSSYHKGDWKLLIPLVPFQPCLYLLFQSYALRFTTSSQAGIVASAECGWVRSREHVWTLALMWIARFMILTNDVIR